MREAFEQSIGEGPPPPPVTAHLTAGKKALRRRRFVVGAGGVAGALILGTAGWGIAAGGGASGVEKPAGPAATDEPSSDPSKKEISLEELRRLQQKQVSNKFPVAYFTMHGRSRIVVKDGWQITQRIPNPSRYKLPYRSLGLSVTNGTETKWMLVSLDPTYDGNDKVIPDAFSTGGASSTAPDVNFSRLEDWISDQAALDLAPPELRLNKTVEPKLRPQDLTRLEGDQIVAQNGATVVEQRTLPVIPDWTETEGQSAKVTHQGRTWFLNYRVIEGQTQMIPIDGDVLPEPTFEALFDHLRAQNDTGEGVR